MAITGADAADGVTATLTLEQDVSEMSTQSLEVPAPDTRGRRAILGDLPLAGIPPGEYTLRISVTSGGEVEERTARFVLEA